MSESTTVKSVLPALRIALELRQTDALPRAIAAYLRSAEIPAETVIAIKGERMAMQRLGYRHAGLKAVWKAADVPAGHDASTTEGLPMPEAMAVMIARLATLVPASKKQDEAGKASREVHAALKATTARLA